MAPLPDARGTWSWRMLEVQRKKLVPASVGERLDIPVGDALQASGLAFRLQVSGALVDGCVPTTVLRGS